jgi:hypothetical protein
MLFACQAHKILAVLPYEAAIRNDHQYLVGLGSTCRMQLPSSPAFVPSVFTTGGVSVMGLITHESIGYEENPLDTIEEIVSAHEWAFDRQGDAELSVCVAGSWCDYHLGFSYSAEQGGVQIACAYDIRIPKPKRAQVLELLAYVNERMWLGHFDLWSEESIPMYRHGILTRGSFGISGDQVEELIEISITECERFYPAFQFVVWGGKTAEEAVMAAMLETVGEA